MDVADDHGEQSTGPTYQWTQAGGIVYHKAQLPRPEITTRLAVTVIPNEESPTGGPGRYEALFVLGIPGRDLFHEALDMNRILASGDSLLQPRGGPASAPHFLSEEALYNTVTFRTNAAGYLAEALMQVEADNFDDATRKAHDVVLPMLSWLSFFYTIPIDVATFKIREETTGAETLALNVLGQRKRANDPINIRPVDQLLRLLLASYREGMNATNPFYQLICFWKVTEGVRQRRRQLGEWARANNRTFRRPRERLPRDPHAIPDFPQGAADFHRLLGRSYADVLDNELQDAFRNAIAHLDPTRSVLSIDSLEDMRYCEQAVPVARFISRVMLLNELEAEPIWERSIAGYTYTEWIEHVLKVVVSVLQQQQSPQYVSPPDVMSFMGEPFFAFDLHTAIIEAFDQLEALKMVEFEYPVTNPPKARVTPLGAEAIDSSIASALDLPGRWHSLTSEQQRFLQALKRVHAQIARLADRYPTHYSFIPIGAVFLEMRGNWDPDQEGAHAKELAESLAAQNLSGYMPDDPVVARVLPLFSGLWCVEHL